MLMFILIILAFLILAHGYVVFRLAYWLGVLKGHIWLATLLASSLGQWWIVAKVIASWTGPASGPWFLTATRFFLRGAEWWLGTFLLLISILVLFEIPVLCHLLSRRTGAWCVLGITAVLAIYATFHSGTIRMRHETINAEVKARIIHLSDIHIGSISESHLRAIIDRTNALNGNVVLISGDIIDHLDPDTIAQLHSLTAITAPVYLIPGNHDYYAGLDALAAQLAEVKLPFLIDDAVQIVLNGQTIRIIGLGHHRHSETFAAAVSQLNAPPSDLSILMYHWPQYMSEAQRAGVDLMLVGHTHGGQIMPFGLFVMAQFDHVHGLYQYGDMRLNVSCGTGTWGPPMRLGTTNEIVVLDTGPQP